MRREITAAGGDPSRVRVLAVTKGFGPEAVAAARAAGLADLGENYANELLAKAPGPEGTRWHFLGAIQRNKIRALAPTVTLWQSVSRDVEGEKIAQAAPGAAVLVQVDFTEGAQRNGRPPEEVAPLVERLRALGLDVRGLMTVAPQGGTAIAAEAFGQLVDLANGLGLEERSMGMSDDLAVAVAAGSTMVRIGRGLFGPRPPQGH
ncbi:MAG TPA: alanine racemase [Acidimicrobiales bacterium]